MSRAEGSLCTVLGEVYFSDPIASENQEVHLTTPHPSPPKQGLFSKSDEIDFKIHPFKCCFQTYVCLTLTCQDVVFGL
jgi:hypothetical protein